MKTPTVYNMTPCYKYTVSATSRAAAVVFLGSRKWLEVVPKSDSELFKVIDTKNGLSGFYELHKESDILYAFILRKI